MTVAIYNHSTLVTASDEMRRLLVRDLADPESAKLREVRLVSYEWPVLERMQLWGLQWNARGRTVSQRIKTMLLFDPNQLTLCGEINAKNRFGAYAGYRPFSVIQIDAKGDVTIDHDGRDLTHVFCGSDVGTKTVYTES